MGERHVYSDLDFQGVHAVKNIPTPVAAGDAANRQYVDDRVSAIAMPTGAVIHFAANAAPAGYLKANGALVSRSTYADLWAFAQASGMLVTDAAWLAGASGSFSSGNGSSTVRLPDLRGEFIRGWADGRSVDTGRAIGSLQSSQNLSHSHTASQTSHSHGITVASGGAHSHTASDSGHSHSAGTDSQGGHTHTNSTNTAGAHTHGTSSTTDSNGAHTHTGAAHQHNFNVRGTSIATGSGAVANIINFDTPANTSKFTELEGNRATTSNGAHTHTVTLSSDGGHTHTITQGTAGAHTHTITVGSGAASITVNTTNSAHSHTASSDSVSPAITVASSGDTEARPRNAALLACIKF